MPLSYFGVQIAGHLPMPGYEKSLPEEKSEHE